MRNHSVAVQSDHPWSLTVNLWVTELSLQNLHEREIKITPCCVHRLQSKRAQSGWIQIRASSGSVTHNTAWLVDHDEVSLFVLVQYLDRSGRHWGLVAMDHIFDAVPVAHDCVGLGNLAVDSSHA